MSKSEDKRIAIMTGAKILPFKPKNLPPVPVDDIMEAIRAEFSAEAIESIRKELEAEDDES